MQDTAMQGTSAYVVKLVCKQTVVQVPSKGVKGVETGREEGCREAPGEDIYKSLGKIKFKAKK
ncbi:hypothetical protein IMZ48_31335 [Candidatus Bathyarchaeota archaeon]|nr:hypothetical protein [Candidatus Bathyarchaeota archaeon]